MEEFEDVGGQDDVHPPTLTQSAPAMVLSIIYSVTGLISSYGWFILLGTIIGLYLWKNYHPKYEEWKEIAEHHKNPDKFIAREMAVSAARQKMQAKYDRSSQEQVEKQEETQNSAATPTVVTAPAPAQKKEENNTSKLKLRPAYNPLMGDTSSTSSCGFRPGNRRTGGG